MSIQKRTNIFPPLNLPTISLKCPHNHPNTASISPKIFATPSKNLFYKCFTNTRKPPPKLPKISLNLPKPHPLHSSDINPEIYFKNITQSLENIQAKLLAKIRCSQFW
jgi:hypothetical protein